MPTGHPPRSRDTICPCLSSCTPASFHAHDEHDGLSSEPPVTMLSHPQSTTPQPCPGAGLSGARRSARLTHSAPGDSAAPTAAAAASAWTPPEVRWGLASQDPAVPSGAPQLGAPHLLHCIAGRGEYVPSPGATGWAWTCAASMRTVPRGTSAAATAVATSAHGCLQGKAHWATKLGPAPGQTPVKGTIFSMLPAPHHHSRFLLLPHHSALSRDVLLGQGT